jgi:non-specific serine/threonine protein kinase
MLETIREYSREKLLESGEQGEVRKWHFDYYRGLAESVNAHLGFFLPDVELDAWLGNLAPEIDNLRAALDFSLAEPAQAASGLRLVANLHWFWFGRGHLSEGREWLDRLLAVNRAVPKPLLAQARLSAGFLGCWQGEFEAARASLQRSLELFEEMGDRAGAAFSLHGLGFAANGLGDHALAGSLFEKSLRIAREIEDPWLVAFTLHFTAIGTSFRGEHDLARSQFEEGINLIKQGIGSAQGKAYSLFHLGRIARLQGDYATAQSQHAEGIRMFWQMGDRRGLGYSLSGFACLALAEEQIERAAGLFGAADSIREELGSLLEAILQAEYEHAKTLTRELLGEEDFLAAWSSGYAMSMEEAVRHALGGSIDD